MIIQFLLLQMQGIIRPAKTSIERLEAPMVGPVVPSARPVTEEVAVIALPAGSEVAILALPVDHRAAVVHGRDAAPAVHLRVACRAVVIRPLAVVADAAGSMVGAWTTTGREATVVVMRASLGASLGASRAMRPTHSWSPVASTLADIPHYIVK